MAVKSRKEANAEKTREALIAAARKLFAERGYVGAGTEDVVRLARVTRGALYHHFRDKRALFDAVVEREEAKLAKMVAATAASESDPWRRFAAGCDAFLEACRDPAVRQIIVLDGPVVLGAARERSLAERYHLKGIAGALGAAMAIGTIDPAPVGAMAEVLLGALVAAAQYVGEAPEDPERWTDARAAVSRLLAGLAARPRHGGDETSSST